MGEEESSWVALSNCIQIAYSHSSLSREQKCRTNSMGTTKKRDFRLVPLSRGRMYGSSRRPIVTLLLLVFHQITRGIAFTNLHLRHHARPPLMKRFVLTTPESIIEQASTTSLLDDLIDESIRTSARRPIIMQFDPSSGWIWKRWKGTVFSETWESCLSKMIFASIAFGICKTYPGVKGWLSGFNVLWGQLLSVYVC